MLTSGGVKGGRGRTLSKIIEHFAVKIGQKMIFFRLVFPLYFLLLKC